MKQGFSESFIARWNRIEGAKRRIITILNNAETEIYPHGVYNLLREIQDEMFSITDKFCFEYLKKISHKDELGPSIEKPDNL